MPILVFFLLLLVGCSPAAHGLAQQSPTTSTLTIFDRTDEKLTLFIEHAKTDEEKRQGLMFRTSLEEKRGMLFHYYPVQQVHMWMKNTYIPLDMMFIDADYIICDLHQNAKPHDLTPISSSCDARYVLEVNAGTIHNHGIITGNRITIEESTR